MSWALTTSAIRERFKALVAVPNSVAVVFGNQPVAAPPVGRWCRVSIQAAARAQVSTGAPGHRRFRTVGTVAVVLFEPLNAGDGGQDALVDAISDAFLGVTLQPASTPELFLRFRPPYPDGEAVVDSGRWWARTVQIPFEADTFGGSEP